MCYTDEDDELWQEDPYEFIRVKYGKEGNKIILKLLVVELLSTVFWAVFCTEINWVFNSTDSQQKAFG